MNNSIFVFPKPENEPVKGYNPGSSERKEIRKALDSGSLTEQQLRENVGHLLARIRELRK